MMDGKWKKKNVILVIVTLVLSVCGWIIYGDKYKYFSMEGNKTVTIGVFSDSYWEVQNGYSYRILEDAIRIFEEEHPGVKVTYTSGIIKEDYAEWLSGQLLSGNGPDVFMVLGDSFNNFAETGVLRELKTFMDKDDGFNEKAYYSSAFASGKYGDTQYALPYECAPKLMFVNKTILEKERIEIPGDDWTWDDLYEICAKVTKDTNGDGTTDQFGIVGYTWEEAFESNGVSIFNQSGTEAYLTGKEVGEALRFLIKMKNISGGYNTTLQDFDLGNVAFQPMSFSEFRAYKPYPLSIKKYSGFEWECIPMPSGPNGENVSTLDTLLIAMNKKAKHENYAWDLMKTLTYYVQVQSEIFDYSEGVSVLREVTESDQVLGQMAESAQGQQGIKLPSLSNAVENAVIGPRFHNIDGAKAEVDRAVEEIINGNGNISTEQIIWNRTINRYLVNNQ